MTPFGKAFDVVQALSGRFTKDEECQHVVGSAVNIVFNDVTYEVADRNNRGERLQILKGISGSCKSGRVLAIMGASGAGKTTLLDILAGHNFGKGTVGGSILVSGHALRPEAIQRISCYVLQRDVLLASSTVRESVTIAALLKLPYALPKEDKLARVDAILQELDLEGCQNTLVGDELLLMKGISGGQKRRVSVGMELVKDPACIFLDEPTSGLDSEMAAAVMDTLVVLARKGRTVAVTIHQPNSIITHKFDDFMLLAAGRLMYQGPWSEATEFFNGMGYPCPVSWNPTDYFMSVLKDPDTIDALAIGFQKREGTSGSLVNLLESGVEQQQQQEDKRESTEGGKSSRQLLGQGPPAPFLYQVYLLSVRMFQMWWRNPAMLAAEFAQYAFMAIFVGLVYLQLSDSASTGVNDRASSVFFSMAILSFTPSYTAVTMWDRERLLLRRESSGGMYTVGAWFTAKTATVTPVQIAQTAAFCVVSYFMVGYANGASEFFVYLAAFVMFQLTSETVGVLCCTMTKNATYAVLILTFVLLFLLSFSGFMVSDIPVYFKWMSKISYLTYAYAAVIKSQFDATTFVMDDGSYVNGSSLIPQSMDNGLSPGVNLLILFAIMIGTRVLAYVGIEAGARYGLL